MATTTKKKKPATATAASLYTERNDVSGWEPELWEEVVGPAEPCPTALLRKEYGLPNSSDPSEWPEDAPVNVPFWANRFVYGINVGPFQVSGYWGAVDLLRRALAAFSVTLPDLYRQLGTEGMLNVRSVRGSATTPSNHCFGMAIDFKIAKQLTNRGVERVHEGLFYVWAVLRNFGFYWGLGFPTTDAMHFEINKETVLRWIRNGELADDHGKQKWLKSIGEPLDGAKLAQGIPGAWPSQSPASPPAAGAGTGAGSKPPGQAG